MGQVSMSEVVITVRASRESVRQALLRIPALAQSSSAVGNAVMARVGITTLVHIKRAFVTKSLGGTDEAGERWKPLSPVTLHLRRLGRRGNPPNTSTDILRDTGLLLNSLTPGVSGPNQVFRIAPGEVVVGTNRKGALDHHIGVPSRKPPLPQRRLWPDPNKWPESWWRDILEQLRAGLLDAAIEVVSEV